MATVHGKSADLFINAVQLDAQAKQVEVSTNIEIAEDSAFGDTAKSYVEGLADHDMSADFNWDPAATNNDVTVNPLIGGGATTWYTVPGGGTPTATNPKYTGSVILTSRRISIPINGIITMSVAGKVTGGLTRATA